MRDEGVVLLVLEAREVAFGLVTRSLVEWTSRKQEIVNMRPNNRISTE